MRFSREVGRGSASLELLPQGIRALASLALLALLVSADATAGEPVQHRRDGVLRTAGAVHSQRSACGFALDRRPAVAPPPLERRAGGLLRRAAASHPVVVGHTGFPSVSPDGCLRAPVELYVPVRRLRPPLH